jgi:hypothetical protein
MIRGEFTALLTAGGLTTLVLVVTAVAADRFVRAAKDAGGKPPPGGARGMVLVGGLWIALTVLIAGGLMFGRFWVLEIPAYLAFGWAAYLERVIPAARPDAAAVASGAMCFVASVVGLHVFLRRLAAAGAIPWSAKRTVQVLLLIAVIFASGVAVVGLVQQTSWLIRTPEPIAKDARQFS